MKNKQLTFILAVTLTLLSTPSLLHAAPAEWQAHKIAGDYYLKTGKTSLAVSEYRTALKCNPKAEDAYFNLAIACYTEHDPAGAMRALEQLIVLRPEDAEAYYDLGCLYLYDGKAEQAKHYFEKGKSTIPEDSPLLAFITQGLEFTEQLLQSPSQGLMLYLLNHGLASALPFQEPDKRLGA